MIDSSSKVGGAWKLLDLFGVIGLENAVHYLMPNQDGYIFIENDLKIKLRKPYKKYYAHKIFNFKFLFSTSRIIGKVVNSFKVELNQKKFSIRKFIKRSFYSSSASSAKYPYKGCRKIIEIMIKLIREVDLEIKFNNKINKINLSKNGCLKISTNSESIITKKLIVSHGFVPPKNIKLYGEEIKIKKKIHPRPSLHIIFSTKNDINNSKKFSQVIFDANSKIKYAHEITQYLKSSNNQEKKFAIVLALKHHIKKSLYTFKAVQKELEEFNLIPSQKDLKDINFFWQDIKLPVIYTSDLNKLNSKSNGKIVIMITEELNSGFGIYSKNWCKLKDFIKKII